MFNLFRNAIKFEKYGDTINKNKFLIKPAKQNFFAIRSPIIITVLKRQKMQIM